MSTRSMLLNHPLRRFRASVMVLLFASSAVVGCDLYEDVDEPAEAMDAQLPQEVCRRADTALLAAKDKLLINFDTLGEIAIPKAEWRNLRMQTQDQIVQAVAVKAVCASAALPRKQGVTIKDGLGQILAERVVPIAETSQVSDVDI